MAEIMKGLDVARALKEQLVPTVEGLRQRGVTPCLAILRVGEKPADLAYERSAVKRLKGIGLAVKIVTLPAETTQNALLHSFRELNGDPQVHGIMVFQPLPPQLDIEPIKQEIRPEKDVDGMSPVNLGRLLLGEADAMAPCTAAGVIEMLDYYKIELTGRRVVIIGRSTVVGKPLALLLLQRHATVTICHTRTRDLAAECRRAQILIAAAGSAKMITAEMVADGAVVVDVGINVTADGSLCGDVDFAAVEPRAAYISPVPGGCGSVTASVLAAQVIKSAITC